MPEIAVSILGITGLLALTSLLPPFANRLNLPLSVMLAGVGCALGTIVSVGRLIPDGGLLGDFFAALRSFEISPEALLYVFLPTLLFETALAIDVRRLLDDLAPILLMAVVAVIVCMLVVGLALNTIADVGLVTCLLLGAIVATTDPVAVVGVFRDLGAPRRLSILVEGESLFNDAAAIALFSLLMAMLTDPSKADPLGTTLALFKGFLGDVRPDFVCVKKCSIAQRCHGSPTFSRATLGAEAWHIGGGGSDPPIRARVASSARLLGMTDDGTFPDSSNDRRVSRRYSD